MLNQRYEKTGSREVKTDRNQSVLRVLVFCGIGVLSVSGCDINIRGKQRPLLRHDRIKGEVELVAERRTDEQGTSGNKRESKTKLIEERVRLKTEGDIYHPDFFFYTAAVGLGLARQSIDSDDVTEKDRESLNDYNIFAQLLRSKSYPTTFHANKSEDLIARQFLGSLRTERETMGASLLLRSKTSPMTFQYNTSETDQDELASLAADFFKRDDERFRYSLTHEFSKSSHMSFDFDRTEVSQRSLGVSQDTDTDRYSLLHDLNFGSDEENRLDSLFNYVDQTGSFDYKNWQWEERLRLQHSQRFQTNYDIRFSELKRETFKNQETRGKAGFEYKLYDNAVTTANIFTSKTDLDTQGDIKQNGGTVSFNYWKNNPWGTLFSTYTASLTKSEQSSGAGAGVIIDESHIFTDPLPISLDRVNIDTSSIVVTDNTGLNIYTLGDDYTVTEINGRIQLNMTTLGGIPPNVSNGQEIYVDYNFFIEPEREEDTTRQNFTIKERFNNGLSLYYAHRRQDEDVSSSLTEITPDEFTVNTIGADYVNKGLFLQAEYSDEDSTQIPSTSKMLQGRYSWPVNKDTRASLRVSNHWLDFDEPDDRDVVLFKSGAEIFSRLSDEYSISARADYRDEDDTRFGSTRGFQLNSEVQYIFRQLSISAGIEINSLNRRNDTIDGDFLYFRLKRSF
ncbi:MAG: hypothetical protein ACYS3N_07650 [Planctomycetota bacterium]